ncbi:N-acetylmuramoyl-L-alanine amidase [Streptomyces daliensis]|uniref:N-acetylmuramoyl-L-alanine amidase n=1 Tax=Streptomyces daliensis TaxID=299421 RepID=A0A8T4IPT9_9ACTN|nr:N-acetylmuramoyl-L-alanine amidase [Streptomyces daliensis]
MPGSVTDPNRRSVRLRAPVPRGHRARAAGVVGAAAALLLPLALAGPSATAEQREDDALQRQFAEAAERYRVPQSVLLGVSYLQSRWDSHEGAPSVSGGYGPMHLTDARTALADSSQPKHADDEDARGDTARPLRTEDAETDRAMDTASGEVPARLRTLGQAARLTGLAPEALRDSTEANVRGGAALLASVQKRLGRPLSADPADWYDAVAAYPGGSGEAAATAFADDVYDVIREGERRTTDSGQRVTLEPSPSVRAAGREESAAAQDDGPVECPRSVSCEWIPAPYEEYENDQGQLDYGNHDKARRPASQKIDYIVVHDVEGSYEGALNLVQDPEYVSWQYTLRASDGHIAQHVPLKDVAWHAGNWYVNSKSVGLEHEGFLTDPDAWYTEAMYRSSARLVRYLAAKYDIPLDRQHILGHDNVPGVTAASIPGMHTDPGPYWDWQHYFTLLGAPFGKEAGKDSRMVTIRPDYDGNRPVYTGCDSAGEPCPSHGSGAVRLHTAPDADAPLVKDIGLRPGGGESTTGVNDTGARASTGQRYAVADRAGEWTAIWYLGEKAWFHNPRKAPTAVPAKGRLVTPKEGRTEIPVYGRAYPEAEAYPQGVPVQKLSPLPYTVKEGQLYAAGPKARGEYLYATTFDPEGENFTVVRGGLTYYQIQLGHRVAFVKADDVRVVSSSS